MKIYPAGTPIVKVDKTDQVEIEVGKKLLITVSGDGVIVIEDLTATANPYSYIEIDAKAKVKKARKAIKQEMERQESLYDFV